MKLSLRDVLGRERFSLLNGAHLPIVTKTLLRADCRVQVLTLWRQLLNNLVYPQSTLVSRHDVNISRPSSKTQSWLLDTIVSKRAANNQIYPSSIALSTARVRSWTHLGENT